MDINKLKKIIPCQELRVIERSRELRQVLKNMANRLNVPALYETDGNDKAQCALHYFDTQGSADWYIYEADLETGTAFGFVTYSGDFKDPYAEWGYVDLFDLSKSFRINLDLHYFTGITKSEINERRYGAVA